GKFQRMTRWSWNTAPDACVRLASRSCKTNLARVPVSSRSVEQIAGRYEKFICRWAMDPVSQYGDPLSAYLVLTSEWAQLVRSDPRLPKEHLPGDWCAVDAHRLFLLPSRLPPRRG